MASAVLKANFNPLTSIGDKKLRKMTCKQLGGACEKEFHATTFEEIATMRKQHVTEMFQKQDGQHIKAMGEIQIIMQNPKAMKNWFEAKLTEFYELPKIH